MKCICFLYQIKKYIFQVIIDYDYFYKSRFQTFGLMGYINFSNKNQNVLDDSVVINFASLLQEFFTDLSFSLFFDILQVLN